MRFAPGLAINGANGGGAFPPERLPLHLFQQEASRACGGRCGGLPLRFSKGKNHCQQIGGTLNGSPGGRFRPFLGKTALWTDSRE